MGSDPTCCVRLAVEAGEPCSQLCKETFPCEGAEPGRLLALTPLSHPAPGWQDLRAPPAPIVPHEESVAPSLSPDTSVDSPQAVDLERSAPASLRIITKIITIDP